MKFKFATILIFSGITLFSQQPIKLQSGNYFLKEVSSESLSKLKPSNAEDRVRIVQFSRVLELNEQQLLSSNCNIINYLPKNAYIISLTTDVQSLHRLNLPFYSISRLLPEMKLTAPLANGDYPNWSLIPGDYIQVRAQLNAFIDPNAFLSRIKSLGTLVNFENDWADLQISISDLLTLASDPAIVSLQPMEAPGIPENLPGRKDHRSNTINAHYNGGLKFDGTGVVVGHGDDGAIGPHIDYEGRILADLSGPSSGNHGDHVAGTIMGAGNRDPYGEGMAKGAELVYYTYPGNLSNIDQHYGTYDIRITNSSYSNGCNAGYTSFSSQVDEDMLQHDKLIHVFSAGNNGTYNCNYGAGIGWGNVTGGHKQGKNVLAVANLTALDVLASSSSRGPAADGRIKPEVSAVGTSVYSTSNPNTYVNMTGTSMACPGTAGTLAQLYQAFKAENAQTEPEGGLMKALIMNGCDDIGNPGPDFKHGYGRINARRSYHMIQNNWIIADSIAQGQTQNFSINIPTGTKQVKIMIHWTDPAGNVNAAYALVNDLNMSVNNGTATYLPWVLDPTPNPANLNANAVRAIDSLNNAEQITIDNPTSGNLTIQVSGFSIPVGTQKYWIVYDIVPEEIVLTYPFGGEALLPGAVATLYWDATGITGNFTLEYSTNGTNWNSIATVSNSTRTYNWNVPNIQTDNLMVRISSGSVSDINNTPCTIIGTPSNLMTDWACPDSIHLTWNAVPGATGYRVYVLGSKYMDSTTTVSYNEATIANDMNKVQWFSVAAIYNNGLGQRALAIEKPIGLINCVLNRELELYALNNPSAGYYNGCTNNFPIDITVKNNGYMVIDTIPFAYKLNTNATIRDTLYGAVQTGFNKVFNQIAVLTNLSVGSHSLSVWLELNEDQNQSNDSIYINFTIAASAPTSLPLIENFDTQSNCGTSGNCNTVACTITGDFTNLDNGSFDDIDWRVNDGATPTSLTGPSDDHGGNGKYIYLESSSCVDQEGILLSECIDLTNAISPELNYWVHMYGSTQGELHIDVFVDGKWDNDVIAPLFGDQGNQWSSYSINLYKYVGKVISIRFRGITGNGNFSDIALDDIQIAESSMAPMADFTISNTRPCVGESVQLMEQTSFGANQFGWDIQPNSFSFVNGTDSSSYAPEVVFSPGTYSITLIAINPNGSDTITKSIDILGPQALPIIEDFESSVLQNGWMIENDDQSLTWQYTSVFGSKGTVTKALYVNNYNYVASGEIDALRTYTIDLPGGTANVKLYFDYAYAMKTGSPSDRFMWQISTDCGATFTTLFDQSASGLSTGSSRSTQFFPSSAEWKTDSIELTQLNYTGEVILRAVNITAGGNNFFLDNINIYDRNTALPMPTFTNVLDTCAGDIHLFECNNPQANEIHQWDFTTAGNPSKANGPGPHSVIFSNGGNITVKHTVFGPGGEVVNTFTHAYASNVIANFNYSSPSPQAIQFNNMSTFAPDSILWTFGDGSSDTTYSPLHTYASGGNYTVTLYAFGPCNVSKMDQTIYVSGIGLAELEQELELYPNPAKDYFDVITNEEQIEFQLRLVNNVGQVILERTLHHPQTRISTGDLPSGVYHVDIQTPHGKLNRKVIIQH